MAIHYRTWAFVLKKEERGEADELLTLYTKDFGKLEILGKGIKKIKSKLRAGINLFYLSEIEFIQGKTYKILTDSILIEKFINIRKSLIRLKIISALSEIADKLLGGQEKDEKIWALLLEVLDKLNNGQTVKLPNYQLLFYYFFWNLLSILGYKPELFSCAVCQEKLKQNELYFSPKEGGLICQKCQKKTRAREIQPETIKILRLLTERNWQILIKLKFENKYLKELSSFSKNYLGFILENQKNFDILK